MSYTTVFRLGLLAGYLAHFAMLAGCAGETEQAKEAPKTFAEILATEVPGDQASLLELVASDTGTKGFYAILKLREVGDGRAVPVLEKVLARELPTTRIHGFAAAQALFCIGTPEAHRLLERHLNTPEYRAGMGIGYTFWWNMDPAKRDAFIERYHLTNTSKDLLLDLEAQPAEEGGKQKITFALTLRNASGKALRVYQPHVYLGNLLVLREKGGHFVDKTESVKYKLRVRSFEEAHPTLDAEASHTYRMVATVEWETAGRWRGRMREKEGLVLHFKDTVHFIMKPGTFVAYGLFHVAPLTKEQIEHHKVVHPETVWSGRVVSKPLEITIAPVPER